MQEVNSKCKAAAILDCIVKTHCFTGKYGAEIPSRTQWDEGGPNIEVGGLIWYIAYHTMSLTVVLRLTIARR